MERRPQDVVLVRHARSRGQDAPKQERNTSKELIDCGLSRQGLAQAKALAKDHAELFEWADLLVVSPLTRAVTTCLIAAGKALRGRPDLRVVCHPLLRERGSKIPENRARSVAELRRDRTLAELRDLSRIDFSLLPADWPSNGRPPGTPQSVTPAQALAQEGGAAEPAGTSPPPPPSRSRKGKGKRGAKGRGSAADVYAPTAGSAADYRKPGHSATADFLAWLAAQPEQRVVVFTHHNVIAAFLQRQPHGAIANAVPIHCQLTDAGLRLCGDRTSPTPAPRPLPSTGPAAGGRGNPATAEEGGRGSAGHRVRLSVVEAMDGRRADNVFAVVPSPEALLRAAAAKSKRLARVLGRQEAVDLVRVSDGKSTGAVSPTSRVPIPWLVDGDVVFINPNPAPALALLAPLPSPPASLVTCLVCSRPRPQDATDAGAGMLRRAVLSARRTLGLAGARTVLLFAGRQPSLHDAAWSNYQRKIALLRADPLLEDCIFVEHADGLDQAEGLRQAMAAQVVPDCPVVYCAQEDAVLLGEVDVQLVLQHLLGDMAVEYVELPCRPAGNSCAASSESQPGPPHPRTELLRSTRFWSDRPHFARRSHYERRARSAIASDQTGTLEPSVKDRDSCLWVYAAPPLLR